MGKFKVKFVCRPTIEVVVTGSVIAKGAENAYDIMTNKANELFRLEGVEVDKLDIVQRVRGIDYTAEFAKNDSLEYSLEEVEDKIKVSTK